MPVPQELIDIIVDNLHDDIPSLKSCALTARAFVGSAQIHIFHRVEINPPRDRNSASPTPCQKLYNLLVSSPHIAPLVTDLSVVLVGSETSFECDAHGLYLNDRQVTWIMTGRTLALVLPLLNLKRISIVENGPADWNSWGEFTMRWNILPRQLRSALTDVFSSPRLEAVHLRGLVVSSPYQLLALFSEASALKELSISRLFYVIRVAHPAAWPASRRWRPRLTSLLISDVYGGPFLPYLISPQIDLAHIKSLTLSTDETEARDTIISTASGLKHLGIWIIHPLAPSTLTANLRFLRFYTSTILELLRTFFTLCPRDASVEIIILEGHVETTEGVTQILDSPVAHLRSLKTVEIKLDVYSDNFSAWSATLRAVLPALEARGMLTITETQFDENEPYHGRSDGWE
ncbi:hypothetical protein C8R46DRAFT_1076042 [Mycena filopes]|nr:hypothetical protein C8R46DRAFT_1076042 [Mycena filopes]